MPDSELLTEVKGHAFETDSDGRIGHAPHEYLIPEGEDPPALTVFIKEGVKDAKAAALLMRLASFVASGSHRD